MLIDEDVAVRPKLPIGAPPERMIPPLPDTLAKELETL